MKSFNRFLPRAKRTVSQVQINHLAALTPSPHPIGPRKSVLSGTYVSRGDPDPHVLPQNMRGTIARLSNKRRPTMPSIRFAEGEDTET